MGLMVFRNFWTLDKSFASSTPALAAARYASSGKTSQPPKTMSSSLASGTNSLIFGVRLSVRLPRRIVPSCVSEPTGADSPRRTSSTPAMKVVLTAPIPGVRTPSRPLGEAIFTGLRIPVPPSPCKFSRVANSRDAKPDLFRGGDDIGAVNAGNKTTYHAAMPEFLQTESTRTTRSLEAVTRRDFRGPEFILRQRRLADYLREDLDATEIRAASTKG